MVFRFVFSASFLVSRFLLFTAMDDHSSSSDVRQGTRVRFNTWDIAKIATRYGVAFLAAAVICAITYPIA
jgi:hypothetical protein